MNLVAEHVQENTLPGMDEKKLFVVKERDIIAELAETDEIKKSREECREFNESYYDRDILSFANALSFMCGKNVYVGEEAAVYFEILDMRSFLLKKYAELPASEAVKYKDEVKSYIDEADEELEFLKSQILKK